MSKLRLRPWQTEAINKSLLWFTKTKKDRRFVINAAPGTGKTICAASIAKELFSLNEIDRCIVIAPRSEIVNQWRITFKNVTNRTMLKITSLEEDLGLDLACTWSSIQNNLDVFKKLCDKNKTLLICDEHHHAAINAAWGNSAESAFKETKYILVLTGTPIRSDGNTPVWFSYTKDGSKLTHDVDGSYVLDYGDAVDLGYCRPIFFHRHEGIFHIKLTDNDNLIEVSGKKGVQIDKSTHPQKLINSIQKSLDYYSLVRVPQYESDGISPDMKSYQASMIKWSIKKLEQIKLRMPEAGALVIAPNIEVAEHFANIVEILTKEKPFVVHSKKRNSENLIDAFRNSKKDWIVSVAMISEGVDIKRLRLLVYLPNAQTELFFRQAMGRVVRQLNDKDDSRAYVVMPAFKIFEDYARRVESEMSPAIKKNEQKITLKVCPQCSAENSLNASKCHFCGYLFSQIRKDFLNEESQAYELTLDNALRMGGIARQMDIDEDDVQIAEKHYESIRKEILESGDEKMIKILSLFPDESVIKLKDILNKIRD